MRPASILVMVAILAVSGCSTDDSASADLPAGISFEILQNRTDFDARRLQVAVTNDTDGPVRIERLEFDSEQFAAPVTWHKDSTSVAAGVTANLPVLLSAPTCGDDDPQMTVTIDYELADGTRGSGSAAPVDRFGQMATLRRDDCLAQSVAAVATLSIEGAPREVRIGDTLVAELDLSIEPTGGSESVRLSAIGGTTLLTQVDATTGDRLTERPLDVTVAGTGAPSTVSFTIAPGRCDPHALAEDKRGTIFGFTATTADGTGTVYVPSSDGVRGAIYEFVQKACAT